jgi:chromosome segregation ATPase
MRTEKPIEAFERLRQSFDVIKANHSDAWSWHQYLEDEKPRVTDTTAEEEEEEDDDPEMLSLKPKPRRTVDRLKSHLLACVAELNRASQAADLCYFHMCSEPKEMKPCCTVLGTSGDIDEELLEAAGDASPEKIMAALQDRLNKAHDRVKELEAEVEDLKDKLTDANATSQDRWLNWQNSRMEAEEALTRLDASTRGLNAALERETQLEAAYDDLYMRMVRASRMMKYKGRQMLRDKIFKTNKKEQIFYSFHGFIDVLKAEKEERVRLEREQQRDTVEFALGNEVRFLLSELGRSGDSVGRLTLEAGRLKRQRRELACRLLTKHRPREVLEYYLWIWELWQPLRPFLVCEKRLEREAAASDALANQLEQAWSQVPPLTKEIDELRFSLSGEQVAHHLTRKQLTQEGARQLCVLAGRLQAQRAEELQVLARLRELDNEAKDERIAVLEREIAEDKHIQALKGMVVDLEGNLRRALDRRKQKGLVVPPGGGLKCSVCAREVLLRNWKGGSAAGLSHSASEADLSSELRLGVPLPPSPLLTKRSLYAPPGAEPQAKYSPLWRG